VREAVFARIDPEALREALVVVNEKARSKPPHYFNHLTLCYGSVRRFLTKLLQSIHFQGSRASKPIQDACQFLPVWHFQYQSLFSEGNHLSVFRPMDGNDRTIHIPCISRIAVDYVVRYLGSAD